MARFTYNRVRYTSQEQPPISPGDGINTFQTEFEIKKSELVSGLNISNRKYPALSSRPGMTKSFGTQSSPIANFRGATSRNNSELQIVTGTTWQSWNGSAFANLATGLAATTANFVEFSASDGTKYTVLVNGTQKKSWDGSSVVDLTQAPASKLYCVDDYRLYALDGTIIKSSALDDITDWTTVNDADENPCSGMLGTGTAIAAYNDMVIAWSEQTMHILFGNDPFDYELSDPIDAGCVSHRSVIKHDGVLYWVGINKIYAFTGGKPIVVSQKIRKYLENINYTYKDLIVSGEWGKYIYFSIPYTTSTTNNITLEYDTELGTWYVWNVGFSSFASIGQGLYGITPAGVINLTQQGSTDTGENISWEAVFGTWESKPLRQPKVLSELYFVLDLPIKSTLAVYYSETFDNNDWQILREFTENSDEQNVRVQIPTDRLYNLKWYRLKLVGTGPCTLYYIEPHIRVKMR